jgi:hypothetical protein
MYNLGMRDKPHFFENARKLTQRAFSRHQIIRYLTTIFLFCISPFLLGKLFATQDFNSNLISAYFESPKTIAWSIATVAPSVILGLITLTFTAKRSHKIWIMVPLLSGLFVLFSNFSSNKLRRILAELYGIPFMPKGLGDWAAIPSLVSCRDQSGCDPFDRFQSYGNAWKVLIPLGIKDLSILFLVTATVYIFFEFSILAMRSRVALLPLALLLSPTFIFVFERGNADIFLYALALLGIRTIGNHKIYNSLLAIFLTSLKPFFLGYVVVTNRKFYKSLFLIPLCLLGYFASMNFNFTWIRQARSVNIFPPNLAFGADQIPAAVYQYLFNIVNTENSGWQPMPSKILWFSSMTVLFLAAFSILTRKNELLSNLHREISELSEHSKRIVYASMAIFCSTYISGSQVTYKTWFAAPFAIILVSYFRHSGKEMKWSLNILIPLVLFATFGVNLWVVRNIGCFFLATLCFSILFRELRSSLLPRNRSILAKLKI